MRKSKSKSNKAVAGQDKHDVIDIASSITQAQTSYIQYLCPTCKDELIIDGTWKAIHPHGGIGYWCCTCLKTFDSSVEKLPKTSKKVTSSIGSPTNNIPFIETIDENVGKGLSRRRDEYAEINDRFEPNDDEQIRATGATIIDSRITITDSQGHNKTLVRRDDDTPKTDTSYY
jgi:hypothetical protein